METTVAQEAMVEARWAAVLAKNPQKDGEFVFAVKTTGIYCRPSCPARPAKRHNVEFFDTPALAAAAGYRACKRCRPEGLSQVQQRQALVLRACHAIEGRIDQGDACLSLDNLSTQRRVGTALKGAASVTEAIYAAGFSSSGRFYELAGVGLGLPPKAELLRREGEAS